MILSLTDVHVKINNLLWVNYSKYPEFGSFRRESFFPSIPAPLWAHSSVLASLKHPYSPHLSAVPCILLSLLPSVICQLWRARSSFSADHAWLFHGLHNPLR